MGCGASQPVDIDPANMAPEQSVDGVLSTTKMNLLIQQKLFSFSGGDFTVQDTEGKSWYKVVGKVMTMRDKMVVEDMAGTKKAVVQRQLMNIRETFQIFRYTPNCAGQESTETDDGTPIYRFGKVEKDIMAIPPCFSYYLYKGNEDTVETWRCETKFALKFKMMIKTPGGGDSVIGAVGQTSMLQFEGGNKYALEIGEGMDILGSICVACAVDQARQNKNNN